MNSNNKYFKKLKQLPIDKFFEDVLYNKNYGYYSKKIPFGEKGDFITAPSVSKLFGEILGIWIISFWENLEKPKNFNIVELGPGNAELSKILIETFKKFNEFNKQYNFYLYEKSNLLKNIQKKKLYPNKVKWISSFKNLNKGPVLFVGNEFFDAIPIKQFKKKNGILFENFVYLDKNKTIKNKLVKTSLKNINKINDFSCLKNLNFIEYPDLAFKTIKPMIDKINKLGGGMLLVDYGYISLNNTSTLQSVINHKKNNLFSNLGKADVTSLVNFKLLEEFFLKNNLSVNNIVSQSFFLKKNGILERANSISSKMNFKEKSDLYYRLSRLLDPKLMGNLFKVIFAFKSNSKKIIGFN